MGIDFAIHPITEADVNVDFPMSGKNFKHYLNTDFHLFSCIWLVCLVLNSNFFKVMILSAMRTMTGKCNGKCQIMVLIFAFWMKSFGNHTYLPTKSIIRIIIMKTILEIWIRDHENLNMLLFICNLCIEFVFACIWYVLYKMRNN